MRTKQAKSEREIVDVKIPLPIPANPSAPEVEEKVNRISFPLDANGKPDWDKMHGKTREKVKSLLGDSSVSKTSGVSQPTIEVFDPAWTGTLFDTIGKIEAFAAQKLYKFPPEIADRAFTYSEMEKAKLAGPTAKVINKYAPLWLEQYKDEIALAGLFVTITAMKFQMASMLAAQLNGGNGNSSVSGPKIVQQESVSDLSGIEREIHGVDAQGNITYKDEQKN
jgi:hypothetical protein